MFIVLDCSLDLSRAFLSFTPGFNRGDRMEQTISANRFNGLL